MKYSVLPRLSAHTADQLNAFGAIPLSYIFRAHLYTTPSSMLATFKMRLSYIRWPSNSSVWTKDSASLYLGEGLAKLPTTFFFPPRGGGNKCGKDSRIYLHIIV